MKPFLVWLGCPWPRPWICAAVLHVLVACSERDAGVDRHPQHRARLHLLHNTRESVLRLNPSTLNQQLWTGRSSLCVRVCVCVSLSVSVCLSACPHLPLSSAVSLCLITLSLFVSARVSVGVCVCVFVCMCVCLCVCLCMCVFVCAYCRVEELALPTRGIQLSGEVLSTDEAASAELCEAEAVCRTRNSRRLFKATPMTPCICREQQLETGVSNKRLKHTLEFDSTAAVRPSRGCSLPWCHTRRQLCGREPPGPDPHTTWRFSSARPRIALGYSQTNEKSYGQRFFNT